MTTRKRPSAASTTPPTLLTATRSSRQPVSKAEQTFRRLASNIQKKREQLTQWQAFMPHFQQRVANEIEPLQQRLRTRQREMVLLIDTLLAPDAPGRKLGRVQREKLVYLLLLALDSLLEAEGDDAELVALHDKYSPASHAQRQREHAAATQAMVSEVLGVDLGDEVDTTDPQSWFAHVERQLQARLEAEQARGAAGASGPSSKKAAAAEVAREDAAQDVSQSLREVYRKLASALHPDREPDATARTEKTLLMQRVNQAYAANDLLGLLNLQWEVAQIDADHLASVPAPRLAQYVQLLRDQLAALEDELAMCTAPFHDEGLGGKFTPAHVGRQLDADVGLLTETIASLEHDMEAFRDPGLLRRYLADMQPAREAAQESFDDMMTLVRMLDELEDAPPRRASRGRRGQ